MRKCVYAIDSNGDGTAKNQYEAVKVHKDRVPWISEENGVGFYVEEMTEEEYNDYGHKWKWADKPTENELKEHSWRNYMHRFAI